MKAYLLYPIRTHSALLNYFCLLLNNASVSKVYTIGWYVDLENIWRGAAMASSSDYPNICLNGLSKTMKTSVGITDIWAELERSSTGIQVECVISRPARSARGYCALAFTPHKTQLRRTKQAVKMGTTNSIPGVKKCIQYSHRKTADMKMFGVEVKLHVFSASALGEGK